MSKGLIRQGMADRLGWVDIKPRSGGTSSPLSALQQVPGISVIFAESLLNNLTGLSQQPRSHYQSGLLRSHHFLLTPWSGNKREAVATARSFQK